jgi:hypothetical protein
MTLVLDLPSDLQSTLSAEAARLNLPLSDYVLGLLSARRTPTPGLRTGAEILAYWQAEGVIGSRTDIKDSAEHARRIREQAQRRQRP